MFTDRQKSLSDNYKDTLFELDIIFIESKK